MRILPFAALCLATSLQAPLSAGAQVTTSDQSIESLKPATAPRKPSSVAAHKTTRKTTHTRAAPQAHAPLSRALAKTAPQVPAAPPANPVIAPPPLVLPVHPPPPPPTVPVSPNAQGIATPLAGGTQITFGPGQSDLNPATLAAIRALATDALANPATIIAITAWAPGTKDDPSTPRRLSLDRALAARAVLINAGLASERIRAIAKGMIDIGSAPPDRAEIVKISPPAAKP
jgi:outer membrane protein OmpA-like peptidoglycan-associated protein